MFIVDSQIMQLLMLCIRMHALLIELVVVCEAELFSNILYFFPDDEFYEFFGSVAYLYTLMVGWSLNWLVVFIIS